MKTSFIIIFAVAVLALAYAGSIEDDTTRFHSECREVNAITPFKLCMYVKVGIMNSNGDIDRNGLKALFSASPRFNSTIVDDIVAHCAEKGGSTPTEAAEALDKCMNERYSTYYIGTKLTI